MMFKNDRTSDDIRLAAFIDGTLPPDQRERFKKEVAGAGESLELLTVVREVMSPEEIPLLEDAPAHLVRRAMDMFSVRPNFIQITLALMEKVIDVLACPEDVSVFRPGFAGGLRTGAKPSDSNLIVIAKIFDSIQVEMEADRGATGRGCTIRISVASLHAGHDPGRLRVLLASQDRELFSGPLENGRIVFEDVHPGVYSVVIRGNGKTIGEIGLKLVEEAAGGGTGGE